MPTAMIAVLASLVVVALVIGRWMTTPFEDSVPLKAPGVLPSGVVRDDLPASAVFECSQPLGSSSEATASDEAKEALVIQRPARPPCEGARAQYRIVGLIDLAVLALAFVATLVFWRRRKQAEASPSLATS